MPLSMPSHGELDAPRTSKPRGQQFQKKEKKRRKHMYLIIDDWELGYSIRKLQSFKAGDPGNYLRHLPRPFISLEAKRKSNQFFAAVGTKILVTHPRSDYCDIVPMIDVRLPGFNLAPGELYPQDPIFIPFEDEKLLFALDMDTFKVLSLKPLWPPRQEHKFRCKMSEWSWRNLPMPRFNRKDVTSYAVDSDGRTILVSTAAATFAFDPQHNEWKNRVEWSLPFSGRAYFVRGLDVFVGLPKDVDAFGHLCFCRSLGDDSHVSFSKNNLSSKDPAESHLGTTLVYMGGSRFCLVESIRNGDDKAVQMWLEERDGLNLTEGPLRTRCCLTTFSLISKMNGDIKAAKNAVQCYKVPMEAIPVAFWL